MKKVAAISPEAIKAIIGVLAGGAAGTAAGYEAMPRLGGYEDVESARRSAALMHGLTGAMAGGLVGAKGLQGAVAAMPKGMRWSLGPALIAEEALPMGLATLKRQQEASKAQAEASATSSVPMALRQALTSRAARGAGAGAAIAGLSGILTGLSRRQTDPEFRNRTTRGTMVAKDVLKYILPAMLAGGIVGSVSERDN